jgi:hypothetical protein
VLNHSYWIFWAAFGKKVTNWKHLHIGFAFAAYIGKNSKFDILMAKWKMKFAWNVVEMSRK